MNASMTNFFHEFAAAAQALEELPQVKQELHNAQTHCGTLAETIAAREESILKLKAEIEELHNRCRSLEVERDDAQFQALEEQDRTASFKRFVESVFGQAGNLLQAAAPEPKPEPTVDNPPTASVAEPISERHDMFPEEEYYQKPKAEFHGDPSNVDSVSSGPQGSREEGEQSPSDLAPNALSPSHVGTLGHTASETNVPMQSPEASLGATSAAPSTAYASDGTVSSGEGVSVSSDPTQGTESSSENASSGSTPNEALGKPLSEGKPYLGKRYVDVPFYVSLVEWLNGGGSEEAYYAR